MTIFLMLTKLLDRSKQTSAESGQCRERKLSRRRCGRLKKIITKMVKVDEKYANVLQLLLPFGASGAPDQDFQQVEEGRQDRPV